VVQIGSIIIVDGLENEWVGIIGGVKNGAIKWFDTIDEHELEGMLNLNARQAPINDT
jgi:hypothetical protein